MATSGDLALRYRGMTREQLSHRGLVLIQRAAETQEWHSILDELALLRFLTRELDARSTSRRSRFAAPFRRLAHG